MAYCLSVGFGVRIGHCFCFSSSFLSMGFIFHSFYFLILGLSIALSFILFSQGPKFYALNEPFPGGLRNIFMIFLSSVYFGNGEKTGSRSGESCLTSWLSQLPSLWHSRQDWEAGGSACLVTNPSLYAHQLHPQVRGLLLPKYPVIGSQHLPAWNHF